MILSKRSRRFLAAVLALFAFFLFCFSPLQQNAAAIAVVDDAFLAIVIAALAAFGIVFTSTGGFGSIQDFVHGIIDQYASANDTTVGVMVSGVQSGSNNLGSIILNNRFVVFLQGLAAFIKSSYALTDNDSRLLVSSHSSVGGVQLYDLPYSFSNKSGTNTYRYELYTGECFFFLESEPNNRVRPMFLSNYEGTEVQRFWIDSSGQVGATKIFTLNTHVTGKPLYGYEVETVFSVDSYGLEDATAYPSGTFSTLINGDSLIVSGGSYELSVSTGIVQLPLDSPDYQSGDGAILDVSASWGMTYDTITGTVIPSTYEDTSIAYDAESVVQDQVVDTPQTSVSDQAGDYTSPGLQSVFPFCIPFDIYNFLSCLAADPVAPSISWRFYLPGLCDEQVEIDLAQFNTVAQIVRTMELLAFIVGLAFVTRSKFLRG